MSDFRSWLEAYVILPSVLRCVDGVNMKLTAVSQFTLFADFKGSKPSTYSSFRSVRRYPPHAFVSVLTVI